MWEFISNLTGWQIAGGASLIGVAFSYVLKKTKLVTKIRQWADRVSIIAERYGYNIGVVITTKMNNLPVIGVFYENCIEPLLALVLEVIPGIILEFCNAITNGMKSDNKEFKKK